MAQSDPKLKVTKPESFFFKPLKADFKELFKAHSKGIGHTVVGKWEELGADAVEALSAIGFRTLPLPRSQQLPRTGSSRMRKMPAFPSSNVLKL